MEHQGFLIASPEYNSSLSPLLKNSLDWITRKENPVAGDLSAFTGKVAALVSASPGGLGGLRGLVPLRMMLGNIGVVVIANQQAISFADKAFDKDGKLIDPKQKEALRGVVKQLIDTTEKLNK